MRGILLITVLILFVEPGCKSSQKTTAAKADVPGSGNFSKPVIDKDLFMSTTEIVPLDTAYIIKDTLHVLTKKILACKTENFKLMWNGSYAKSLPPQASLKLLQIVDTNCKEKRKFHLTYNLIPVRYNYSKQDSTSNKATIIHLGGFKDAMHYIF